MNWVVLRFPCDMKTAARAEKVLEQLNKGLPPEVRGTRENSMDPMPDDQPNQRFNRNLATVWCSDCSLAQTHETASPIGPRPAFKRSPSNASH